MAIAAETSSHSTRHTSGKLFCRMSAQAMGVEATALCHRSHWVPKSSRSTCSNCRRSFRLWAGKHHCRLCGEIVCGTCSTKRILFQSKRVRTCDDCVDTNVQNVSETTQHQSTPKFLHSKSSPAAFESYDAYERRSLQNLPVRPADSRVLQSHQSLETSSMMCLGMATITSNTRVKTFSSKEMAGMKCHLTISSQTHIVSLVVFVVSIVCLIKLVVQVST